MNPPDLDLPDLINIDDALLRPVGRRGVAVSHGKTTPAVREIDLAAVLVDAAERLGPTRFARLTGCSDDEAAKLTGPHGRKPRRAKIRRLLAPFAGERPNDPQAIARLIDMANAAQPRCALDGCPLPAAAGKTYCTPEHAQQGRRVHDRDRKRRTRARRSQQT